MVDNEDRKYCLTLTGWEAAAVCFALWHVVLNGEYKSDATKMRLLSLMNRAFRVWPTADEKALDADAFVNALKREETE